MKEKMLLTAPITSGRGTRTPSRQGLSFPGRSGGAAAGAGFSLRPLGDSPFPFPDTLAVTRPADQSRSLTGRWGRTAWQKVQSGSHFGVRGGWRWKGSLADAVATRASKPCVVGTEEVERLGAVKCGLRAPPNQPLPTPGPELAIHGSYSHRLSWRPFPRATSAATGPT